MDPSIVGIICIIGAIVFFLAVYFTARAYWQKTGNLVRGNYSVISSDVATNDQYVREVTLENLKDRSIVIFGIYLHLSVNYIVELERFDESPLILKPFEVVRRKCDPVDGYSFNLKRIDLNNLFSRSHKKLSLCCQLQTGSLKCANRASYGIRYTNGSRITSLSLPGSTEPYLTIVHTGPMRYF